MRRILCMSHGPLAKGMIESLSFIVGNLENVDFRCAYINGNNDIEKIIDDYLKEFSESEIIVVTDIFGGSINNEWLRRLPRLSNVYLISGMNLSLLVDLYLKLKLASTDKIEELIEHAIETSASSIKFCNQVNYYEQTADEF
jgi:fructoselysine and glucoselysine-specific PTS system IIA component